MSAMPSLRTGAPPVDEKGNKWKAVWTKATSKEADTFWEDEFKTPAMLVRLKLKRLGEVVDGYAPIAAASHSDDLYEPVMERSSPPPVSAGVRTSKRGATAAQGYAYEVNKERRGLCKAFQKGKCER